jgi:hypothetical protein
VRAHVDEGQQAPGLCLGQLPIAVLVQPVSCSDKGRVRGLLTYCAYEFRDGAAQCWVDQSTLWGAGAGTPNRSCAKCCRAATMFHASKRWCSHLEGHRKGLLLPNRRLLFAAWVVPRHNQGHPAPCRGTARSCSWGWA